MEQAFYIAAAAMLCIGPIAGFLFGVKCCAGWFGIDLRPGDKLSVTEWSPEDMPEVYRHELEPDAETPAESPENEPAAGGSTEAENGPAAAEAARGGADECL